MAALADTRSQLSHHGRVTPGFVCLGHPSRADGLTRERPRRSGHRSTSYVLRAEVSTRPSSLLHPADLVRSAADRSAPSLGHRTPGMARGASWVPRRPPVRVPPAPENVLPTVAVQRSAPPPADIERRAWPVVRRRCRVARPSAFLPHQRMSYQQSRFSGRRPSCTRERCTYYGIRSVKRREVRRSRGVGRYPEGRRPTPACADPSFGRGSFGGPAIRRAGHSEAGRYPEGRRSFGRAQVIPGQVRRFTAD